MDGTGNLALFLQTTEVAVEKSLQDKIHNLKESWKEVQTAFQSIKLETSDTLFRVRGEAAKKADKIAFWRKQYKEALEEIEELRAQLEKIEGELKKLKEEKSAKNHFIRERNDELLTQLQEATEEKIRLVDELLDEKSEFYRMNYQERKEHFKKLKLASLETYKTLRKETPVDSPSKLLNRSITEAAQC